jgi:hypothetical protein
MADRRGHGFFGRPRDPIDEVLAQDDPRPGDTAPRTWTIYDGRPETVSDGVEPMPSPAPPSRRVWSWTVTGLAAAVVVAVVAVSMPATQEAGTQPAGAIAPAQWGRVDASLTAGLVTVHGGAEADGIVLAPSGLIVTSYSRIQGDQRLPADGFQLLAAVDGQDAVAAEIAGFDGPTDVALVRAPEFVPASVARPGGAVHVGDTLTLLDDQGGQQPVVGVGVTVTATDQTCSRAGSTARPTGFRFSLQVASAEPGAALVRADGTVVGMYFGGDDATHHCAIPIADVLEVVRDHGGE